MELADTAIIDKGAFAMLGSDDFLLRQLAGKQDFSAIKDYIAWTMHATQAIAVKVVNPGGISAFNANSSTMMLGFPEWIVYALMVPPMVLTGVIGLAQTFFGDKVEKPE